MRSRYTAFVLGLGDYLLASWHPDTRPATLQLDAGLSWLGLDVKAHRQLAADEALVEFVARCRQGGGRAERLHEVSRFLRRDGHWLYVEPQA